jgi:hypothetical protein
VRGSLAALVAIACALSGAPASARGPLNALALDQPESPVHVVGCSADETAMRDGNNVTERASFVMRGPKTATAVRIGFAYFDALGQRSVRNALTTGTFTPGARIDLKPYAGRIGAETRDMVCFALQAAFDDGTTWSVPDNQVPRSAKGEIGDGPAITTVILPQAGSPVTLERCTIGGPHDRYVTTQLALTNASDKAIKRVDVDFIFYDATGKASPHVEWMTGDYAPGAAIAGHTRLTALSSAYPRIYCTPGRVEFADGTRWSAGAGFLKDATPP